MGGPRGYPFLESGVEMDKVAKIGLPPSMLKFVKGNVFWAYFWI